MFAVLFRVRLIFGKHRTVKTGVKIMKVISTRVVSSISVFLAFKSTVMRQIWLVVRRLLAMTARTSRPLVTFRNLVWIRIVKPLSIQKLKPLKRRKRKRAKIGIVMLGHFIVTRTLMSMKFFYK